MPAVGFPAEMSRRKPDVLTHQPLSFAGYTEGDTARVAVLLRSQTKANWYAIPDIDRAILDQFDGQQAKSGRTYRLFRPYPSPNGAAAFSVVTEPTADYKRAMDLDAAGVRALVAAERTAGRGMSSIAACVTGGEATFAAVTTGNTEKWEWSVDTALSASGLKTRAEVVAKDGFSPACVTAYPFDGAVRYCAVWVKEPPKPVPFQAGPTRIETPGWEVLTGATKDQTQAWLDARKKAGHSVVWLDAVQIGDKPLFTAVAALDTRQPDWKAILDTPADDYGSGRFGQTVDARAEVPVALSGYADGKLLKAVSLWRKGRSPCMIDPTVTPEGIDILNGKLRQVGGKVRVIRPYPLAGGDMTYGLFGVLAIGEEAAFLVDVREDRLRQFLKESQEAGERITSLAACPKDGRLLYTVVGGANPEKLAWKADTGLRIDQFRARAAELAADGYHPAQVTAYPWDGAVRYCVVWLKDPPGHEEPDR